MRFVYKRGAKKEIREQNTKVINFLKSATSSLVQLGRNSRLHNSDSEKKGQLLLISVVAPETFEKTTLSDLIASIQKQKGRKL